MHRIKNKRITTLSQTAPPKAEPQGSKGPFWDCAGFEHRVSGACSTCRALNCSKRARHIERALGVAAVATEELSGFA